jgi:hypothetical protein
MHKDIKNASVPIQHDYYMNSIQWMNHSQLEVG